MKNIPVFTAVNGIASLILQEIPHSGKAYILIRSVWTGAAALLEECRGFLRAAGAEEVYASWGVEDLPGEHAYDLIAMTCRKADLPGPQRDLDLEPLTRENGEAYLRIYNRCFQTVSGAATYGPRDLERLYGEDKAWLVKENGIYAAVAEISEEGLEGIAVLPEFRGLGYHLALAVLPMVPSLTLNLKVAGNNSRAIALYERLGFTPTHTVSRWFRC